MILLDTAIYAHPVCIQRVNKKNLTKVLFREYLGYLWV